MRHQTAEDDGSGRIYSRAAFRPIALASARDSAQHSCLLLLESTPGPASGLAELHDELRDAAGFSAVRVTEGSRRPRPGRKATAGRAKRTALPPGLDDLGEPGLTPDEEHLLAAVALVGEPMTARRIGFVAGARGR